MPTTIDIRYKPCNNNGENAHVVGLAILAKLTLLLPKNSCKLRVTVIEGAHVNKAAIDKQINDKERVASTFEMPDIWVALINYLNLSPQFLEGALGHQSEKSKSNSRPQSSAPNIDQNNEESGDSPCENTFPPDP